MLHSFNYIMLLGIFWSLRWQSASGRNIRCSTIIHCGVHSTKQNTHIHCRTKSKCHGSIDVHIVKFRYWVCFVVGSSYWWHMPANPANIRFQTDFGVEIKWDLGLTLKRTFLVFQTISCFLKIHENTSYTNTFWLTKFLIIC